MTVMVAPGVGTPGVETSGTVWGVVGRSLGRALVVLLLSLAGLVGLWWLVLKVSGLDPLVAKGPVQVWQYFFSSSPPLGVRPPNVATGAVVTASGARSDALHAALTTVSDAALGFVVGFAFACLIAVLFVLFSPFEFAFMPIAMLLRTVPLVAMAPLIMLVFGQGTLSITVIGTIVVLFPAMINIVLGLRSAPPAALDVVRVNGGGRVARLLRVQIPSALPNIFAAVRISVPGAMVGAMLGEFLVGFNGIGGEISTAHSSGHSTQVWALAMIGVVMSFVLYSVTTVIESAVLAAWGPEAGSARQR